MLITGTVTALSMVVSDMASDGFTDFVSPAVPDASVSWAVLPLLKASTVKSPLPLKTNLYRTLRIMIRMNAKGYMRLLSFPAVLFFMGKA
jgi:hypothetical protein